MFWALMPEASIHKNCQLKFGKDKIRFAEYWPMATPAGDALAAKQLHQCNFRFLIPASTYT